MDVLVRTTLQAVRNGQIDVDEALRRLGGWRHEALPFATIDHHRALRNGYPEVVYCAGKTPAQAAHAVGVARQTAYTWKAVLDEGGIDALRAMPTRGRPARLDDEQLQALGRALLQRPTEHGFGTELWTLKRVGVLIERLYGVKFGQTQIWRILGGLGFSVQKPERRAIERDEDAVQTWKRKTWPALKKKPRAKGA